MNLRNYFGNHSGVGSKTGVRFGRLGTDRSKMADPGKKESAENPFPVIPGVPSRSELMKPLIFPNSQRGFKIFTWVATVGKL